MQPVRLLKEYTQWTEYRNGPRVSSLLNLKSLRVVKQTLTEIVAWNHKGMCGVLAHDVIGDAELSKT